MNRENKFLKTVLGRLPRTIEELREGLSSDHLHELVYPLAENLFERTYLEGVSEMRRFVDSGRLRPAPMVWVRLDRLPLAPGGDVSVNLLHQWQNVLSAFHSWNDKMVFCLQRKAGVASMYLGVCSPEGEEAARGCVRTALFNCLPGVGLSQVEGGVIDDFHDQLMACGAVTGIPSLRNGVAIPTLDRLAFGIRDQFGKDIDFSIVVVANPIDDPEISEIVGRFLRCGTAIHAEVARRYTSSESKSAGNGTNFGFGLGAMLQTLGVITGLPFLSLGGLLGTGVSVFRSSSETMGASNSVSEEVLDKSAQYVERLADKHAERLRRGRNLGFGNCGVYVLSQTDSDVRAVTGMLRTLYSGDDSYVEPLRLHLFRENSGADRFVRNFQLVPLGQKTSDEGLPEDWHLFGMPYQSVATPVNSEELSILTSLPQRDVPGIRFVKNAVRFASNPGESVDDMAISLGKVKDFGVVSTQVYSTPLDSLTRHALITGGTGSGKSTTVLRILNTVMEQKLPFLVIEPVKDEYVRWAIEQNRRGARINIYMPGIRQIEGVPLNQLKLNPFEPAAVEGATIDMLTHLERLTDVLNASLPTADVLPVLIEEALYQLMMEQPYSKDFLRGEMPQRAAYPLIGDLMGVARRQLNARGYDAKTANALAAALETRFKHLVRGKRGELLNVEKSTSWDKIFTEPTVINISKLGMESDRAMIMSILMLGLYAYQSSRYETDAKFRDAQRERNRLTHLTVLEEAHSILMKPPVGLAGSGNAQQVLAGLVTDILSQIRAYGAGVVIVDQSPTRLIPDAIKNTDFKVVHKLKALDDCDAMASALALRRDQAAILPMLEKGDAIVLGDKDDAASWVHVNKN